MGIKLEKINQNFAKLGERIVKMRWLNILFFLLLIVISFVGISRLETETSNDNWFLENDPTAIAKEKFEEIFGNTDFAAVLVEVDDLADTKVLEAIRELSDELEDFVPLADEVMSLTHYEFNKGTDFGMEITDLIPDPVPTDKKELDEIRQMALSKQSMIGKLYTKEFNESWVLLRLKEYPEDWKKDKDYVNFYKKTVDEHPRFFKGYDANNPKSPEVMIGYVVEQIVNQDKYKILNPKTSGMPMVNFEKRRWFGKESMRLSGLALLLAAIVLAVSLRSVRGVIFPIINSILALIIIFGIEGFVGIKIDPSMITMPMFLGFAVSVGYSVHVFTFYKIALRDGESPREAAVFSVEETGWPILFTALTTIGALMSFLFIEIKTLRWIGLTSAAMIGMIYITTIVLLPSLISFGKRREKFQKEKAKSSTTMENFMARLNEMILANPKKILMIFSLIMIVCIYGMTKVDVSFDIRRSMSDKVPYAKRLIYIGDSNLGTIYSYEIGVEFPNPGDAKLPKNLHALETLEKEIQTFRLTKRTRSILDIIKDINQTLNEGKPEFYKIPSIDDVPAYDEVEYSEAEVAEIEQQMIAQTLLLYENAGGAEGERWMDYDDQRFHIMVEISDYNSRDIKNDLNHITERFDELFPGAILIKTGTVVQYSVMQDIVAIGQIKSFLIALIIIAVLLIVVFGSVKAGLIGIIPNIVPALVVGGLMGFLDIPLDMMTVTIMPMLLGLAVDDTIHFINHAHLSFERTGNYNLSMRRTFMTIGVALCTTSIVLILNFSAYFTSPAKVYFNIGMLAASGILAALLADFFVTPVLLKMAKVFGENEKAGINKKR